MKHKPSKPFVPNAQKPKHDDWNNFANFLGWLIITIAAIGCAGLLIFAVVGGDMYIFGHDQKDLEYLKSKQELDTLTTDGFIQELRSEVAGLSNGLGERDNEIRDLQSRLSKLENPNPPQPNGCTNFFAPYIMNTNSLDTNGFAIFTVTNFFWSGGIGTSSNGGWHKP